MNAMRFPKGITAKAAKEMAHRVRHEVWVARVTSGLGQNAGYVQRLLVDADREGRV